MQATETNLDKTNPFYYSLSGNKAEDAIFLEPLRYILQVPGKQIRIQLINAFNYWLKISDDKLQAIKDIVNIIHNASILIDDIQDNSTLRRGIPVSHSIYGIATTMNTVTYSIFIVLERIINLHPVAPKIFVEQLLELHRGQGLDIFWRDKFICPNEADYKAMIIKSTFYHVQALFSKTGALFDLLVRLMKLFSSNEEDFSPLITTLGLYFQLRDDYCNLCLQEYTDSKNYCEDLTEGKFSFPIIHALTTHPDDKQIITILKQRPKDVEVKRYCVKLLEKFGSLKYTRAVLEELDTKARAEIERHGGNPHLEKILDGLRNWD